MTTAPDRSSPAPSAGTSPAEGSAAADRQPDLFASLFANLAAWWRDARAHAALTIDGACDRLMAAAFAAAISVMALAGILAITVVGAWFLVSGAAGGFESLFGSHWLGQLTAGLLGMAAPIVALTVWTASRRRARLARLARRYDHLAHHGAQDDHVAAA